MAISVKLTPEPVLYYFNPPSAATPLINRQQIKSRTERAERQPESICCPCNEKPPFVSSSSNISHQWCHRTKKCSPHFFQAEPGCEPINLAIKLAWLCVFYSFPTGPMGPVSRQPVCSEICWWFDVPFGSAVTLAFAFFKENVRTPIELTWLLLNLAHLSVNSMNVIRVL